MNDFEKYVVIRGFVDDVPTLTEEVDIPLTLLPLPSAPKLSPLLPEVIDSSWGEWDDAVNSVDADPEVISIGIAP